MEDIEEEQNNVQVQQRELLAQKGRLEGEAEVSFINNLLEGDNLRRQAFRNKNDVLLHGRRRFTK